MFFRASIMTLVLALSPVQAQECHTTEGWDVMDTGSIQLEMAGQTRVLTVRVADNSRERAAGYQWICDKQAHNTAVLFKFPKMILSAFHMRNVYVPLDIYFFDETGKQVDALVMRPEPPGKGVRRRYYQPVGEFKYALEIARPQSHDLNATPAPIRLLIESL